MTTLQALSNFHPKDNRRLISTIHQHLKDLHHRGTHVALQWVPGHVGIPGNERADVLARQACSRLTVDINIATSQSAIHTFLNRAALQATHNAIQQAVINNSQTARWYAIASISLRTDQAAARPAPHPNTVAAVTRLRLGFPCYSTLKDTESEPCKHCLDTPTDPLLHYLLECPATTDLRTSTHSQHTRDAAAAIVADCPLPVLYRVCTQYPPPR